MRAPIDVSVRACCRTQIGGFCAVSASLRLGRFAGGVNVVPAGVLAGVAVLSASARGGLAGHLAGCGAAYAGAAGQLLSGGLTGLIRLRMTVG
jgi:hypothetical protein